MSLRPKPNKLSYYQTIDFVPSMSIDQTIDAARDMVKRIPADEFHTAFSVMQTVQDAIELAKEGSLEHKSLSNFQSHFKGALREKWPRASF